MVFRLGQYLEKGMTATDADVINHYLHQACGAQPSASPRRTSVHPTPTRTSNGLHNCSPRRSLPVQAITTSQKTSKVPQFDKVSTLQDEEPIRAAGFHPTGRVYAIGTNSKRLHLCSYDSASEPTATTTVLSTVENQHNGAITCLTFNPSGNLIATGSTDTFLKVYKFNAERNQIDHIKDLTLHDGTIHDVTFIEDGSNATSLLLSGGIGTNNILVTDCKTMTPIRLAEGHTAPVTSLFSWGGCEFASASTDRTVRLWDLRSPGGAVNVISATGGSTTQSHTTAMCIDTSGRLLVTGHTNGSISLFDLSANRVLQTYKPHTSTVRSLRFSPGRFCLLSGGFDGRLLLSDLRGDLLQPLRPCPIGQHRDKVLQCRWHPREFAFVSTSVDRSAVLWKAPTLRTD